MIDMSIFLDYYFTKWLFMASVVYGIFRLVNKIMKG